ncbi:MAG: hypothetical protein WCR52_05755 [Bacteroidota bacterium]
MPKNLPISQAASPVQPVGKEQKRFNRLVNEINLLRLEIEQTKQLDLELRKIGQERITPVEKAAADATRAWVLVLHNHPARQTLNSTMRKRFAELMLEQINEALDYGYFDEDETLLELFRQYDPQERSYQEYLEAAAATEIKTRATEAASDTQTPDFEEIDFTDPDFDWEKFNSEQAGRNKEKPKNTEKKAPHKRVIAKEAAEAKRLEAEKAVKKTAKQLYIDLVKHFHPDREPDEQKRAEKTEVMKDITSAYDADDHLQLLELQMTLLKTEDNALSGFNNQELKYFNSTLQQQVNELKEELYCVSPDGNGNLYAAFFDPDREVMLANVEHFVRETKKVVKGIAYNTEIIREEGVFRDFVLSF